MVAKVDIGLNHFIQLIVHHLFNVRGIALVADGTTDTLEAEGEVGRKPLTASVINGEVAVVANTRLRRH